MASNLSIATSDHGDLKRRIAELIDSNPSRYSSSTGEERHARLLADEIDAICEVFDMRLEDESKPQKMDAVMIRLGRDHRTGVGMWDVTDLIAVIEALEAELGVDDAR